MANNEELKVLDYDGLKTLVSQILGEIPIPDGKTVVRNDDGTLSAKTLYKPIVGSDGNVIFSSDSPVSVSGNSLIIS